ncbi:hypothetical protein [Roseomonas xinghualingensis]
MAQKERELISERTRAALEAARGARASIHGEGVSTPRGGEV